jgi:subtilase-type serine protease
MAVITSRTLTRATLAAGTAFIALGSTVARADTPPGPVFVEDSPGIIIRHDLSPNLPPPAGILDEGINGVGQVVTDTGGGSVGVCTGTLINPRTVIFAAHCVNDAAASDYGAASGGIPMSVGFQSNNLNPLIGWINGGHQTNEANAIYNVESVWYDPRSLGPNSGGFLEGDIALATLDTPAFDIPTWTMLFSPLEGETHAIITGYGNRGTGLTGAVGIDWRRRSAENMVSALASLDDRNDFLFGPAPALNPQSLYQLDFDSPEGQAAYNPAAGRFDFDLYDGAALPREGTTAGGDSGGPLIIDQLYSKPVVAAVLSGGSRFFAAQPHGTYGTSSFYQPLFLFWDAIVANNPYRYAGNKAGIRSWTDPRHWVQLMDPNYAVDRDGQLVNDLPDTPALGVSGNTPKFGTLCFLDDCIDLAEDPEATPTPEGNGKGLVIPGGPGSTNFVPDNVVSDPSAGIAGRYWDVTLAAPGITWLSSDITIDRLTVDGPTKLDIRRQGDLTVLGDFTQWNGWTHVDGWLRAGEALVASGILSGSGHIDPTYLTVGKVLVAPGGADIGTLTVHGDVILTSASLFTVDVNRNGADRLAVVGDESNPGQILLGGGVLVSKAAGAQPRHGQSYQIITAQGGVSGTFDYTGGFVGVLKPELEYGANAVTLKLKAGSLFDYLRGFGDTARAFGSALDALRGGSYSALYGLYGEVDLMDPVSLAMTFDRLNPAVVGDTRALQDRQSVVMLNAVTDRLPMLGAGRVANRLSIVGSPRALNDLAVSGGQVEAVRSSFTHGLIPAEMAFGRLPEGMSGFVSGGFSAAPGRNGGGQYSGDRAWHVGMGLETEVVANLTIGTAFGYSNGYTQQGGSLTRGDSRMSQIALYGAHRLGGGAYVAGMAVAERSQVNALRQTGAGALAFSLGSDATSARYAVQMEAGVNVDVGRGLTLTPRASLGYSSYALSDYREAGGEAALIVDKLRLARLEARAGAQLSGSMKLAGGWALTPQVTADWVQMLAQGSNDLHVRFAAAPSHAFILPFQAEDGSWGEVRGGLRLANGPFEIGAGVETDIGRKGYRDNRAVADATIRF